MRAMQIGLVVQALVILGLLVLLIASGRGSGTDPLSVDGRRPDFVHDPTQAAIPGDVAFARGDTDGLTAPVERRSAVPMPPAFTWKPDDPIGLIVHGRITDADGALVAGAHVQFGQEGQVSHSARQSPERGYAVLGLAPGKWDVACIANGFDVLETTVELDGAERETRIDLELSSSTVVDVVVATSAGTVWTVLQEQARRDGTSPPPRLDIRGTTEPLTIGTRAPVHDRRTGYWRRDQEATQNSYGRFVVGEVADFDVCAVYGDRVVAVGHYAGGPGAIRLTVDPEDVHGLRSAVVLRVVDAGGRPIAGANVRRGNRDFVTGAGGEVHIPDVVPGRQQLTVTSEQHETKTVRFDVPPTERVTLSVALGARRHLAGTIRDADGNPVRATFQWTTDEDLHRRPADRVEHHSWSNDDGTFLFTGLGPGRVALCAWHREHGSTARIVDLTDGSVDDLDLRLTPGHPVLVTRAADSRGRRKIVLTDIDGLPVCAGEIDGTSRLCLPTGRYRLHVDPIRGPVETRTVTVAGPETVIEIE